MVLSVCVSGVVSLYVCDVGEVGGGVGGVGGGDRRCVWSCVLLCVLCAC